MKHAKFTARLCSRGVSASLPDIRIKVTKAGVRAVHFRGCTTIRTGEAQ